MEKIEKNLKKASQKTPSFLAGVNFLISDLSDRSQEIIRKRFGLAKKSGETLEKIGAFYGITRERVRQIIAEVMKNISKSNKHKYFQEMEERIIFTIGQNGGIIKKSEVAEKFHCANPLEINAVIFFVGCSKRILEIEEKERLEKSWIVSDDILDNVKKIITHAEKVISEEKKLFSDEEIFEKLSVLSLNVSRKEMKSFLNIASSIKRNKFGKWGMISWAEINPKGTREKVHLILKEQKKPLHFTKIANFIDEFELGKRKAHPQTVHNELIKDERFVLIGRGIYALREWGYFKGTIKDVIKNIILEREKKGKKTRKEVIIEEVLSVREVKKTTIMINLNNRNFFERKGEFYSLKK